MGTPLIPSFTHVVNPFPAPPDSEHAIASRVTWASLQAAQAVALRSGARVQWRAVVLPGDEAAVEPPVSDIRYLSRTVMDVANLSPRRPFPLIADLLTLGAQDCGSTHVIFTNMDIAVHQDFYPAVRSLVEELGPGVPFTIGRVNVDRAFADGPLQALYNAEGSLGRGYDCFVMPCALVDRLDLGNCCIAAPHFDLLLYMQLDALSGQRLRSIDDRRLTYHLGSDIGWAARIDHIDFNLRESLAAIDRIRQNMSIPPGSIFDRLDRGHFRPNNNFSSRQWRRVKRVPGLSLAILQVKRFLRRQF